MNYYLLEQDLRIPDIAAIGGVPDHIEPLDWMRGKKMAPPGALRLQLSAVSGDERGDIMGSLLTLFSDELKDAMTKFGVDSIDYFPVELENPNTHEIETGYWLANVLGLVGCVDMSRSVIVPRPSGAKGDLESFYVDPKRAMSLRIFRLAEDPTLIVINHELREFLRSLPLAGVRLRHTKTYDGF